MNQRSPARFAKLLAFPFILFWNVAGTAAAQLPRVLILGDSVYQEPAKLVATNLKGRVEVVYSTMNPGEVLHSGITRERLDQILGEGKWDLIHFNFGLGDLLHKAPGLGSIRAMAIEAGGVKVTSPEQYEKNLQAIVTRLKQTGAKLIWASTTPIRHSTAQVFEMGSEITYNAIAARVMAQQGIPIHDMYTFVLSSIDMTKPASHGADPFFFDKASLDVPVVETILQHLKFR